MSKTEYKRARPQLTSWSTSAEIFRRAWDMQDGYEALTLKMLDAGELGVESTRIMANIQKSILLISAGASCQWGCRGGDHTVENLLRRYCNYAFGAIRLACLGLYDESLALIRSFAEVGNLLQLFSLDHNKLDSWKRANIEQKLRDFSPFKVRLAIESLGLQPIIEHDTYGRLCEIGVHVSPRSVFLSHEFDRRLYLGGHFSIPGLILVINQMALLIAPILLLVGDLIDAPDDKKQELSETSKELTESAISLNVDNYEDFFNKHTKELVMQGLKDMTEEEFESLYQEAVRELTKRGELPEDTSRLTSTELQDKVFTQIYENLSQLVLNTIHEQHSSRIVHNARGALVESILQKSKVLQQKPDVDKEHYCALFNQLQRPQGQEADNDKIA